MKKLLFVILSSLALLFSCATTSQAGKEVAVQEKKSEQKNLYKGKDLVIAVTLPQTRNVGQSSTWIPQYLQDSLTGNFANYSKMTVLDRSNENLIKAEQELSESGFYTDENAVQFGQMTNAALVVVGSIQQIGGMYEVNFRINDITTNEIKAGFNNRYDYSDIENGMAVNEITKTLLEGLGIELSENEKTALSKVNKTEDASVQNLAKGMTAEKSNDYITALVAYSQVEGSTKNEAQKNINMMLGTFDSASLNNRLAYYESQINKWNSIFFQLEKYMNSNAAFVVYDFSSIQDSVDMQRKKASFTVAPGIKCVQNRVAMQVYASVISSWKDIISDKDNDVWTVSVKKPRFDDADTLFNFGYSYMVTVGLFNGDGDIVAKTNVFTFSAGESVYYFGKFFPSDINVKSQKKYYAEAENRTVVFDKVKFEDIAGDMTVKIIDAKMKMYERTNMDDHYTKEIHKKPLGIYSAEEWKSLSEKGKIK